MKVTGIQCPRCYEEIWSRHRHDYRFCSCGYSSVDGGRDYLRFGWGDRETGQALFGRPIEVEIEVPDK